jgi:isoamylase
VREITPRPAAGGTGTDFVAEPWAIGTAPTSWATFRSGWSEWNGNYRDLVRQAQNELGS